MTNTTAGPVAEDGRRGGGRAWVAGAVVLGTAAALAGNHLVGETWRVCWGFDHESTHPYLFRTLVEVWALMLVVLLTLGAVLGCWARTRRWRWPALAATAVLLTLLFWQGMGTPHLAPGGAEGCTSDVGVFPFVDPVPYPAYAR